MCVELALRLNELMRFNDQGLYLVTRERSHDFGYVSRGDEGGSRNGTDNRSFTIHMSWQ